MLTILSNESKAVRAKFDRIMIRGFWVAVAMATVLTLVGSVLIG